MFMSNSLEIEVGMHDLSTFTRSTKTHPWAANSKQTRDCGGHERSGDIVVEQ